MKTFLSAGIIGLTAMTLLSGCNQGDDETKKQLAALQQQLADQQKKETERLNDEQKERERIEQAQREERIYEMARQEAEEELKMQKQLEAEEKTAEAKKKAEEKKAAAVTQQPTVKKAKEKLARFPAFVVSESGYGQLNLRGAPSTSAVVVSKLSDGEQVTVTATTDDCTAAGCWVKVQTANGIIGYVNDGYLQRGRAPQRNDDMYDNDVRSWGGHD